MHEAEPVGRPVLVHRFAQVGRRAVVVEIHGAIGPGRPHLLRNAFGLNALLLLAGGQLLLQLAQLGHVGVGAKPAQHLAGGLVANGPGPAQKPAVLAIVAAQREGVFPGLARSDAGQVAGIHMPPAGPGSCTCRQPVALHLLQASGPCSRTTAGCTRKYGPWHRPSRPAGQCYRPGRQSRCGCGPAPRCARAAREFPP